MKKLTLAILFMAQPVFCLAQPVSYESVRIAETLTENTWGQFEEIMPIISSQIEQKLLSDSISESSAKTFSEELNRSFNKENATKAIAQALTDKFSENELKELSVFLNSNLGKKFAMLSKDIGQAKYMNPILKQACDATIQRLDNPERENFIRECSTLK